MQSDYRWRQKKCVCCFFFCFFYAISVFAVLSGNSLEEPLGDLPTPFSAHTETQRSVWHAHTHTHLQKEKGKQMWCCSTGEDIKLVMHFIILLFLWPLLSAINKCFALLMLLCDTATKPAWSCRTNPYSDGTALRSKVQNTPTFCITHPRYLSSL